MDINIIKTKSNKFFKDNILSKNELKYIFIYTYENRVKDVGLPIFNKADKICYFITGFNIIARLQYIIYKEIDNLTDIDEIKRYVHKINNNLCLDDEESKKFNKYLLIQTLIEVHSDDIIKKIYYSVSPNNIQKFIEFRLNQYSFSESTLNKNINQKLIEYIIYQCDIIKNKCETYFKNKYNKYLDTGYVYKIIGKKSDGITDKTEKDALEEGNNDYLKKFSDIYRLFNSIKSFIERETFDMNGMKSKITDDNFIQIKDKIHYFVMILLKNIGKYFCKITDKDGHIQYFILKQKTEKSNITEIYNNFYGNLKEKDIETLEKNFTEIYNDIKDLLRLIYYKIYDLLKITDFKQITPDEICNITKLNNMDKNKIFLSEKLAVNAFRSGSESSIVINSLIDMLNTNFIETKNNFTFVNKPYYIYNQPDRNITNEQIPGFLRNKYEIKNNGKTYKLCAVSFVCPRHSVTALCYDENCNNKDFIAINEMDKFNINLNEKYTTNEQYNLGKMCERHKYYIDKMIYESIEHKNELKTEMNAYITKNRLGINKIQIIYKGGMQKYKLNYFK